MVRARYFQYGLMDFWILLSFTKDDKFRVILKWHEYSRHLLMTRIFTSFQNDTKFIVFCKWRKKHLCVDSGRATWILIGPRHHYLCVCVTLDVENDFGFKVIFDTPRKHTNVCLCLSSYLESILYLMDSGVWKHK